MKTEAGRKKKIETFVAMLKRGETIYPQRKIVSVESTARCAALTQLQEPEHPTFAEGRVLWVSGGPPRRFHLGRRTALTLPLFPPPQKN